MKFVLDYNGVQVETPRMVIKEGFKAGILKDGEGWIDMLEDRDKTSHIYDEAAAAGIYGKIKRNHFPLLEIFHKNIMSCARPKKK